LAQYKIIHDSVHGSVRIDQEYLALAASPELQRLHSVHQLGLAYLVYPGANHSRFEHSLGTFAVAGSMCRALKLDREETALVRAASLLHDIGHLPYSHTFEMILHGRYGVDHVEISRRLIRGEESVLSDDDREILGEHLTVPEALERSGISPEDVANLLEPDFQRRSSQRLLDQHEGQAHFSNRRYLSQIVSGTVDADQLDYLVRDAHYTGVAYGVIDLDRLLETFDIFNGDLVVDQGGLSAVEGMMVARSLMFSSVYFHKTVRISELMLAKAVEQLPPEEIDSVCRMTDPGLLAHLEAEGGYCRRVATLIKYRRLFKNAFGVRTIDAPEEWWGTVDELSDLARRRSVEDEIAHRAGVDPGEVIIDIPSFEIPVSEPRMMLADLCVLDGKKARPLNRVSTIASSLQNRRPYEWALLVACPEESVDKVSRAAKKLLAA